MRIQLRRDTSSFRNIISDNSVDFDEYRSLLVDDSHEYEKENMHMNENRPPFNANNDTNITSSSKLVGYPPSVRSLINNDNTLDNTENTTVARTVQPLVSAPVVVSGKSLRTLTIELSPSLPRQSCRYEIIEGGVVGITMLS